MRLLVQAKFDIIIQSINNSDIKQLIIDRAIELRIPDNNKLAAITEFTGRDVSNMIKLETELDTPEEEKKSSHGRRVVSKESGTSNQRRVTE